MKKKPSQNYVDEDSLYSEDGDQDHFRDNTQPGTSTSGEGDTAPLSDNNAASQAPPDAADSLHLKTR